MLYDKHNKLKNCHQDLQILFKAVAEIIDVQIIEGFRNKEKQEEAYKLGKSMLHFPYSRHNRFPSRAVDICPYPIDWNDIQRFKLYAVVIKNTAKNLNINVEWGGDWTSLKDYPHWQV